MEPRRTPGGIDPATLVAERLAVHHAAWIVGSVAHAVVERRDDDSHTNLGVAPDTGVLRGRPLDASGATWIELDVEPLRLVLRERGEETHRLELVGRTLRQALDWARDAVGRGGPGAEPFELRSYPDFPDHELGRAAPFAPGSPEARAELIRWFAFASSAMGALRESEPAMDEPRVWPHHFDLGALIPIDDGCGVGCGFSPGDENHGAPYLYVYAYPAVDPGRMPELESAGVWTRAGFTGALLTASELVDHADPQILARAFLSEAVGHFRASLE